MNTGVGGHYFLFGKPAVRTGNYRMEDRLRVFLFVGNTNGHVLLTKLYPGAFFYFRFSDGDALLLLFSFQQTGRRRLL